jgi:hypothetical protein
MRKPGNDDTSQSSDTRTIALRRGNRARVAIDAIIFNN